MTSKADRKRALKRAAAHLDDVELEEAFNAALRGDMEQVERRLSRVTTENRVSDRTLSWKESSSWLFGRTPFRKG
jgi:hypothetical protein